MFRSLVAIEPVNLTPEAKSQLSSYAEEVRLYDDMPGSDEEIQRRIGDADAVLISYTSQLNGSVIRQCPNLRYVGMCCSLYAEESANVDIRTARELGVTVTGVRDYGDQGVVEYVLSELVRYLHGFGDKQWKEQQIELASVKVGVIGLGTTGGMIAEALSQLGAHVCYYSRTRKPEAERRGIAYQELPALLVSSDVAITCLTKNVILLHEEEFELFGNHKILFNTSIAPGHDDEALKRWLDVGANEFFCDSPSAVASADEKLIEHPHVNCVGKASGGTSEAIVRLSRKVLANIEAYLDESR